MKAHAADPTVGPVPWSNPWYQPWRIPGMAVERQVQAGLPLWQALNQIGGAPVHFVAQTKLPPHTAYEQFIAQTGRCPTRASLHDFFNGLCWINFPATKHKLNQLQATRIAADGVLPVRGPVRDALTLLDENSAFLHAPDALWEALAGKQWQTLFVHLRPLWREARLVVFGHALLEKLHAPRKPMTAHVYRTYAHGDSLAALDAWVAADLNNAKLATKPFAHLPMLGVPGWWEDNAEPGFYDDATVFRVPRPPPTRDAPQ